MVVFQALKDLGEKKKRTCHDPETDLYASNKIRNQEGWCLIYDDKILDYLWPKRTKQANCISA